MVLKQVLEMFDFLDRATANGKEIGNYLEQRGAKNITVEKVDGNKGSTDFIKILIEGKNGKSKKGTSPTLGILGQLGGIGARPEVVGFVSDGDGALSALAIALKLVDMQNYGDYLSGDVIVTTHICPNAPTLEHHPVPFMDSPVELAAMHDKEVLPEMDAILSIDTTKGNNYFNHMGFSITPTIKEGYILKPSEDLLDIMSQTTGKPPMVFPVSQQDLTPYGNGLSHVNSILQPSIVTSAPLVGVAITTEAAVAGCATGASHPLDVEGTSRFAIETAKRYGDGNCSFFDEEEYSRLVSLYGNLKQFQSTGR